MTQRRTPSQGHRPLMGPPETPSRGMIPQSPGLFPNIQFSPDLFSQQMMDSQSAPVYPQQRLFWDPATATPLQGTPQHFHTPIAYPDDFNTSFNSSSTIVPLNYAPTQQETTYDLPTTSEPMHSSFLDVPNFSTQAAFHTSPRPPLPAAENPTQFLSSPARRFGGDTQLETSTRWQQTRDLPAYHHQLQESKREQEMLARQRRKSRTQKRPAEEDLVMKSVRRALSPSKVSRPAVTRSNTLAGHPPALRRSSSTIDNISITSSISSRSNRAGRSSPLRQVNDNVRRVSTPAVLRPSSSMSLEIDRNGVARTILAELPERTSEDMEEGYSTEELSSEDEMDHQMLYSFDGNSQLDNDSISRGDARDELRSSVYLSMGTDKSAQIIRDPIIDPRLGLNSSMSTIKRARGETLTSSNNDNANPTNAQQALRNLMQDRSRSASSHASTSSMQFHSSPPLQQGHLPRYNASPTTANDAELATPSTDVDSIGSSGQTRCVCNSASAEGNLMLQCISSLV
ncbi:hypothetical protein LTR05_001553 [Lithohypha guttulata]|uniref:PHD finger domain protein n=1 Tax=Lithohypha guttulata TaxID=1690604 RepID=A0AAN7T838_9EURO|nr:hypothetical protein LTR05_001553 [Lithohypha guttulata]